jgi:hypothetical protein
VSVTLLAKNRIASASLVAVAPAASATKPVSRLYDGDRGPQYEGDSAAQTDLDADLGSALACNAWAFVNPNITGVTAELFGDSSSPPAVSRDTVAMAAVDVLETFTEQTLRYWRARIPAMAFAPAAGELVLGPARIITENPSLTRSRVVTVGNVHRDRSPGGYAWAAQLGDKRLRLVYGWTALHDDNVDVLLSAFDDSDHGAVKLVVKDPFSVVRWMDWLDEEIEVTPIGNGLNEVAITLEQAL